MRSASGASVTRRASFGRPSSWLIAYLVTAFAGMTVLIALPTSDLRWTTPVLLSAPLILVDVVRWLRNEYDVFDPVAMIALLGTLHFVLLPFLLMQTQGWPSYLPAVDWEDGLSRLAWLNLFGLLLYRAAARQIRLGKKLAISSLSELPTSTKRAAIVGLVISMFFQVGLWSQFGGFTGYISAIDNRYEGTLAGLGPLLVVAESAPIFFTLIYISHRRGSRIANLELFLFFSCLVGLTLVSSGLRGSRSNVIYAILVAAILVHRFLRPISRGSVALGVVLVMLFAYGYGFYKTLGSEFLASPRGQTLSSLEEATNRSFETILTADLGKTGIQAWTVARLSDPTIPFDTAKGDTYASALTIAFRSFAPTPELRSRNTVALDLRFGPGRASNSSNSQVFGLAGEAMLNFGPAGAVFAYGLLGLILVRLQKMYYRGSVILVPLSSLLGIVLLNSDLDNVIFIMIKNGAFPALILATFAAMPLGRGTSPRSFHARESSGG